MNDYRYRYDDIDMMTRRYRYDDTKQYSNKMDGIFANQQQLKFRSDMNIMCLFQEEIKTWNRGNLFKKN